MASASWLEKVINRARAGLDRPAPYGPDVDVLKYAEAAGGKFDPSRAAEVGFDLNAKAQYVQVDQSYFDYISKIPGVEVSRIDDFVENEPDVAKDYVWALVDPGEDKYTAIAALRGRGGYFIRVKRGSKVEEPIMACLFIGSSGLQAPHNVVIVEEGAEATVYTGCTIAPEVVGLHVGISEFYVEKKAKLRFVMVHAWNRATHVRPRTVTRVGEGGEYVSYYVNVSHARSVQTYPVTYLESGARTYMASVLLGVGETYMDVGSAAYLLGDDSGAELVSKAVAKDSSNIITRALIEARAGRGHIECSGLMLSPSAVISTVPELRADAEGVDLTHEASIGRLAEDEINYLVSKGFSRRDAISTLIRGFIAVDIPGIPERVRKYMESVERFVAEKAL
ncbi:MAG: SufD family Fe-S cluster assembly protein [Desulfurococcaceae archaeon]